MRVQLYIDTAGPGMQYKNMRRAIYILNFFIMFTLSVSDPMYIYRGAAIVIPPQTMYNKQTAKPLK